MARRSGSRAPYEIMGAVTRGSGSSAPADDLPEPEPEYISSDSGDNLWTQAVRGASVPVILRLPRGFAVLAAAGVLSLIVLSYWVGYTRGVSATEGEFEQQTINLRDDRVPRRGQVIEMRSAASNGGFLDASDVAGGGATADGDPRREGLNYLIVARFPRGLETEAERLASFLREGGVEAAAISSDNGELFHVVGLQGYTTEEYRAGRHHAYMDQVRRLGRQWKTHNNGKGSDLSDMWWKLH